MHEKQLRRLFCFLVFQHESVDEHTVASILETLSENNRLYPETFENGINSLNVGTIAELVGERHQILKGELRRIKTYRNKLMHGQLTGRKLSSRTLENDVQTVTEWIVALSNGAQSRFGYDGITRNTFRAAKASANLAVNQYPFSDAEGFKSWLTSLTRSGCGATVR